MKIARQNATTILELLAVLAIVAILAAFAGSTFFKHQLKARRLDAKVALQQIVEIQERVYVTRYSYSSDLDELGLPGGRSEQGHYVISVPVADEQGFLAIAVPAPDSSQVKDSKCQQFAIDNNQVRTAMPDPGADCW